MLKFLLLVKDRLPISIWLCKLPLLLFKFSFNALDLIRGRSLRFGCHSLTWWLNLIIYDTDQFYANLYCPLGDRITEIDRIGQNDLEFYLNKCTTASQAEEFNLALAFWNYDLTVTGCLWSLSEYRRCKRTHELASVNQLLRVLRKWRQIFLEWLCTIIVYKIDTIDLYRFEHSCACMFLIPIWIAQIL